jgi:uncharacterized protein YecT (DUF1311 family)
MKDFLLSVCFALISQTVMAAELDECAATPTTMKLVDCLGTVLDKRELYLKNETDRVVNDLKSADATEEKFYDSAKKYFALSRSAWESYSENDCLARSELVMTGTARPIIYLRCKISHTNARIAELDVWPRQ